MHVVPPFFCARELHLTPLLPIVQGLGRGSHRHCLASSRCRRVSAIPDVGPRRARHFLPSIKSSCAWLPSMSFTCAGPSPSRSPLPQSFPPLRTSLSPVRTSLSPSPHLLTHLRSLQSSSADALCPVGARATQVVPPCHMNRHRGAH
jgi:hypothetical protein